MTNIDRQPLHLRFVHRLPTTDDALMPLGPLFHRWGPEGEVDAIDLATGHASSGLRGWLLTSDPPSLPGGNWREIEDVDLVGILDARPRALIGVLTFRPTPGEEAILRDGTMSDSSVDLARRVLALIGPAVESFLRRLQIDYGQYWIAQVPHFDSRHYSLGQYCSSLEMSWSADGIRGPHFVRHRTRSE